MGYSVEEFERVLPAAMRDWAVSGGRDGWRIATAGGEAVAAISIRPLPMRRMGSLQLPVLAVTIEPAAADALAAEFMRRFERGFHRGGG